MRGEGHPSKSVLRLADNLAPAHQSPGGEAEAFNPATGPAGAATHEGFLGQDDLKLGSGGRVVRGVARDRRRGRFRHPANPSGGIILHQPRLGFLLVALGDLPRGLPA